MNAQSRNFESLLAQVSLASHRGSLAHFRRTNDSGATPRNKPISTLELRLCGALAHQIFRKDEGARDIRHN